MEGFLAVPPERNVLIGRAIWKTRFVSLGPERLEQAPSDQPQSQWSVIPRRISAGGLMSPRKHLKFASQNVSTVDVDLPGSDAIWLTIYKQPGDVEYISRYSLDSIRSVCIEDVAQKGPGPALPTLVVTLDYCPYKRRSSQSGNVPIIKTRPNVLLFRPAQDDARDIQDWYRAIQNALNPRFEPPLNSPFDPTWGFNNSSRPLPLKVPQHRKFHQPLGPSCFPTNAQSYANNNANTNTTTQPKILSPSPSVRSSRSELSSSESDKKSFFSRGTSELPSPIYEMPLTPVVEGHALVHINTSSPSAYEDDTLGITSPISPRRETILDRAFMMNCIPGVGDLATSPEQNSVERFEALMRDIEARKAGERDSWGRGGDSSSVVTAISPRMSLAFDPPKRIPTPTKRALEFISSGRKGSVQPPDDDSASDYGDDGDDEDEDNDDDTFHSEYTYGPTHIRRRSSMSFFDDHDSNPCDSAETATLSPTSPINHHKRFSFADFTSHRLSTGSASFIFMTHATHSRQGSLSSVQNHDGPGPDEIGTAVPMSPHGSSPLFNGYSPGEGRLFREFSF